MAIEGLRTVSQSSEVNISDHVGASVKALTMLGLVEDRDQVAESVTAEFSQLSESGITGEAFIQLPRSVIVLGFLVEASDSATYTGDKKYPRSYAYRELWTPGSGTEGYKADQLDNLTIGGNGDFTPHARLAVHNPASEQEPLLHFLDMPFDKRYAGNGQQTQLDALDEAIKAYEAEAGRENFEMTALNAKAVAFIALVRRIKGEAMPISWGFMRDATLPRETVGVGSFIGRVNSVGDQLRLHGSGGNALSNGGVGVSVGPKPLNV